MLHVLHRFDPVEENLLARDNPEEPLQPREMGTTLECHSTRVVYVVVRKWSAFTDLNGGDTDCKAVLVVLAHLYSNYRRGLQLGLGHLRCCDRGINYTLVCVRAQDLPRACCPGQKDDMSDSKRLGRDLIHRDDTKK